MKDCLDIKIYYEDTDCGGVVYYGKYLGFLERARTEFMESRGMKLLDLMKEGIYFVVAHVDISYRASAHYGDVITVCSDISGITAVTITFHHTIFRKTDPGTVLVEASVKLASVGQNMKPLRLKKEITGILKTEVKAS
jgi:acyl-CoA thioester hydrolase